MGEDPLLARADAVLGANINDRLEDSIHVLHGDAGAQVLERLFLGGRHGFADLAVINIPDRLDFD